MVESLKLFVRIRNSSLAFAIAPGLCSAGVAPVNTHCGFGNLSAGLLLLSLISHQRGSRHSGVTTDPSIGCSDCRHYAHRV